MFHGFSSIAYTILGIFGRIRVMLLVYDTQIMFAKKKKAVSYTYIKFTCKT